MTPTYVAELGFITRKISVRAQKIDSSPLKTYGIVLASFSLQDILRRVWFFEETFFLADTSIEVVLGMPFLTLSNADFQFSTEKLTWRTYTAVEALPTTCQVKLINKKEFVRAALNENLKTFIVYISALEAAAIHPSWATQIAALQWDKTLLKSRPNIPITLMLFHLT